MSTETKAVLNDDVKNNLRFCRAQVEIFMPFAINTKRDSKSL